MFIELKCPNCTSTLKLDGSTAVCKSCGSNFLIEWPSDPSAAVTPETRDNTAENNGIKLIPITKQVINMTSVFILTGFIWGARFWMVLGIISFITVLLSPEIPLNSMLSIISYILAFIIMFGLPSYTVHQFSMRKRKQLLQSSSRPVS